MKGLAKIRGNPLLQEIFENLYDSVTSARIPIFDYNGLYSKITGVLQSITGNREPKYFQWTGQNAKDWAKRVGVPLPPITGIAGPPCTRSSVRVPPWPNQKPKTN